MRVPTAVLITMALFATGCMSYVNSWRNTGHQKRVTLPVREMVYGTRVSVSVRLLEGDFQPFCNLPDAANDIDCVFYRSYLEHGLIMNPDGYLFMDGPTARQACGAAMWSANFSNEERAACSRALMQYRWMVDYDYGTNKENE